MDKLKYSSPYPSEVVYRSDKNFIVRLKAMIDRNMKEAGYSTYDDRFKSLIQSFDNAEEYLFDESPGPATPSVEVYRKALEQISISRENANIIAAKALAKVGQPEQVKGEEYPADGTVMWVSNEGGSDRTKWYARVANGEGKFYANGYSYGSAINFDYTAPADKPPFKIQPTWEQNRYDKT
jgi:hypothetical protein